MSCGPTSGWCGNVRAGESFVRGRDCERCWLMTHSAPHRKNWGVEGPAVEVCHPPPPPPKLTGRAPLPAVCPHLGEPTGETVPCASCRGLNPQPTYRCDLHGLTVLGDRRPKSNAVTACRWCPDRPRTGSPPGREDTPKK